MIHQEARAGGLGLWRVILCTPTGDLSVIAETRGWQGHCNSDIGREYPCTRQLRGLIAQLGVDGWEPMTFGQDWYFKRQLPDDAT